MSGFPNSKWDGGRIKSAFLALLLAGLGWMGTAASANAIDLTYAAYRIDGVQSAAVRPGDTIGFGEKLLIKVRYLNGSPVTAPAGFVVFTLPQGCAFVKAEQAKFVEVSVDGGHAFGPLDRLEVRERGRFRAATGADVTHIRLALIHPVASGEGGEIGVIAAHE